MKHGRAGLIAVVVVVAAGALALRTCDADAPSLLGEHLELAKTRIDLRERASRLSLAVTGARGQFPLTLRLRDGASTRALPLGRARREGDRVVAPVLLSEDRKKRTGQLVIAKTADGKAFRVELEIEDPELASRDVALAVEAPVEGRNVFVSGVGELADVGDATGAFMLWGEDPLALAIAAEGEPITTSLSPEPSAHVGTPKIVRVSGTPRRRNKSTLIIAADASTQALAGAMFSATGSKTETVRGVVTGATPGTRLYALDDTGKTRLRAIVGAGGRFEVAVPVDVNRWYAAIDESRTSIPIFFEPGAKWDLKLDVSPGGELVVRVRDADGDSPLIARIAVRGIEGTLDPSFGPDYRASGAGPLVDVRSGEAITPLPSGRYRVSATRGIEWSIDAKDVTVEPGSRTAVELRPRHVVPTPGEIGCDLHVHARPSFDSPVLPEDRVLSLVAAGIDFAVPTEHNLVGDYGPAVEIHDLSSQFSWVPGVEVTTYTPRFGHFGVFPVPVDGGVPPYRRTTPAALFAAARRDPKRVVQVNHPRLAKDIGYFEVAGFDPKEPRTLSKVRLDFDSLEVYSGFDVQVPSRVDEVLADYYALLATGRRFVATGSSDAHRIQYNWAGYPRTMIRVDEALARETPTAVVDSLKHGRATVTSGPIVALEVGVAGAAPELPGGELSRQGRPVVAHVVVRAAPWIDVTEVTLVADGEVVGRAVVESRPSKTGPEPGTLAEAQARAIRYDGRFDVPARARWVMAHARGARKTDDVLAFMPIVPLAFTNPVWLKD